MKISDHTQSFGSKVLLFGEYTIISGGIALSIPFHQFHGQWIKGQKTSNLLSFFKYLKTISFYNTRLIDKAIEEKWIFDSNIPMGYGVGSSGAVCAAAYHVFANEKTDNLLKLKEQLAQTESFFHGNSSGLDPLTIYLNEPILIENQKMSLVKELKPLNNLYLLDSNKTRNTKSLVEYFFKKIKNNPSLNQALRDLDKANKKAILSLFDGSDENFKKAFKQISLIQFQFFKKMIPDDISSIWEQGLLDNNYYVKLSGAGGGGYFLVHGSIDGLQENHEFLKL